MASELQDLYRRIVAAERPCPGVPNELGEGYQGGGRVCVNGRSIAGGESDMGLCDVCGGSGKVPVLPLLRETCEVGGFYHYVRGEAYHNAEGCPGWQAKPLSLETVIDAIVWCDALRDHHGMLPSVTFEVNERGPVQIVTIECGHSPEPIATAAASIEALLNALAQVIGVEA